MSLGCSENTRPSRISSQPPGHRRGIYGRFGSQRSGSRQAGKRKIGILRKFLFYPHLFYRNRIPDRSGRNLPEHHFQFPPGFSGHRRAAHREVDSSTNCGSRLRLYSSRAHEDVVTHVAAGGDDARGHLSRLRYSKSGRSTPDRWPIVSDEAGSNLDRDAAEGLRPSPGTTAESSRSGKLREGSQGRNRETGLACLK
jgi:hypothetical protein